VIFATSGGHDNRPPDASHSMTTACFARAALGRASGSPAILAGR
jgi:hypothetical protein